MRKKEVMDRFNLDKQFIFFLIQNIIIGICSLIDTGFGNQLGTDTICVLSAYTVLTWLIQAIYKIGSFAFNVVLKDAKLCLYIQTTISIILSIMMIIASNKLPYLYTLTNSQYELFKRVLIVHAILLPFEATGEYLKKYLILKCKNKLSMQGNIIFYTIMITTDAYVVYTSGDLSKLMLCTIICYTIYDGYIIIRSEILKESIKGITINRILELIKYGSDVSFDRITASLGVLVYNVYASKLGSQDYSIHAVCCSVAIFGEQFTNALYIYEIVKLKEYKDKTEKFKKCIHIAKKYIVMLVVSSYIMRTSLMVFMHGEVDIIRCVKYSMLYNTNILVLILYEPMKAYLMSCKETKYLRIGGILSIVSRIITAMTAYYSGLGLKMLGIVMTVDFGIRGVYYWYSSKCILRKEKLNRLGID